MFLKSRNGGQGGGVNVPWETGVSSPKLGLARRYGSFVILLCELCSAPKSALWHEFWSLVVPGRYVFRSSFIALV